jgi:hypothetical protein
VRREESKILTDNKPKPNQPSMLINTILSLNICMFSPPLFLDFLFSAMHAIPQLRLITHFRLSPSHASRKCIKYTDEIEIKAITMLFNFLHSNTLCVVGHVIGEVDEELSETSLCGCVVAEDRGKGGVS